jgi:sigma-B regulation protein RsbU (phosphoserine phosphatase)
MPLLRIELKHEKPFDVELTKESFAIGRSSDNDLIFNQLSLSRHHARLFKKDERYYLEDTQSRNGTLLNGIRIYRSWLLNHKDVIQLGEITLRFISPPRELIELTDTPPPALGMTETFIVDTDELDRAQAKEDISGFSPGTLDGENLWLALSQAAAALIAHHPMEKLVEVIMDVILQAVPAERGALIMMDPKTPQELTLKVVRGPKKDQKLQISRTIINEVIQNQKAILTQDAQSDDRFRSAESVQLQGIRSIICVPLWNERNVIGLIYMDNLVSRRAFTQSDLRLAAHIANMAAAKIENALLLEEQLKKTQMDEQLVLAAQIQRRLMPQFNPKIPNYEIYGISQSCDEIGGDYYDFIEKADGNIGIVIADASGRGVGAALLMAGFQASVRSLSKEHKEPSVLITKLNRVMLENSDPDQYITIFYAELDWVNHTFEYVNAGHIPPVLLKKGSYTILPGSGQALGIIPDVQYDSKRITLDPGDLVFLYTNGIPESRNPKEEEFGESGIVDFLMKNRNVAVEELSELLEKNITEFVQGVPALDDSTMVLIKRLQ